MRTLPKWRSLWITCGTNVVGPRLRSATGAHGQTTFLRRFCARCRALADVTIATIDRAVNENNARDGRPRCRATIRTHADALRAFFRFAEARGWSRPGLAALIVAPRVYRDAALPVGPSPEEQRRLLATTEGGHPADLRDRALVLTLSAYGLRAGEARGIQLDDIDWQAQTLRVRRPKTGSTDLFPLSRRVGGAIARYLHEARPPTNIRALFLSLKAPARPLSASGISSVIRSRMQRCGIDCPRRGAHALRHAFAQRLLGRGLLDAGNRRLPRAPQPGLNRGVCQDRPRRLAPRRRLRLGGAGMTLRKAIDQYIAWKRAQGARFQSQAYALRRYCRSVGDEVDCDEVSRASASAFLTGTASGSSNRAFLHSTLAGFYRYALARGLATRSPLPAEAPKAPASALPYIYSCDELRRLMDAREDLSENGLTSSSHTPSERCCSCCTALACGAGRRST